MYSIVNAKVSIANTSAKNLDYKIRKKKKIQSFLIKQRVQVAGQQLQVHRSTRGRFE